MASSTNNKIRGRANQVKSSVKKAVGKITGDPDLEAQGEADRLEGKVEEGWGKAKESVRKAVKKL